MNAGDLSKQRKRTIVLQNTVVFLLVLYFVLSTAAQLYNGYTGAQTRTTLIDCVEPKGECAKRGQEGTAKAVDSLIKANALDEVATRRVVILAAVCSEEPGIRNEPDQATRIRLMETCVQEELNKESGGSD